MAGLSTKTLFAPGAYQMRRTAFLLAATACLSLAPAKSQVFTVQREHLGAKEASLTTVQPTSVQLESTPITERTKQQLIRTFQADEAFAVRPIPLGMHGVVLHANGPLSPSGTAYADELEKHGIWVKPGYRVVITKFVVRPDRILFEFNDGPE